MLDVQMDGWTGRRHDQKEKYVNGVSIDKKLSQCTSRVDTDHFPRIRHKRKEETRKKCKLVKPIQSAHSYILELFYIPRDRAINDKQGNGNRKKKFCTATTKKGVLG